MIRALIKTLIEYANNHLEFGNNKSDLEILLRKDKSTKTHHKNWQVLATKIWKVKHGLSLQIINNVFELKSAMCNMRREDLFRSRSIHSVGLATDSLTYLRPKIWNAVPQVFKNCDSPYVFKTKTKQWIRMNYPCRLCMFSIFKNS